METEEYNLWLQDRIQKIQQIEKEYHLTEKAYISYSGGKDSTVLTHLIDKALPENKIPRVYINTGIEYNLMVAYVKQQAEKDDRIKIVAPSVNIEKVLREEGFPFKSKEHSQKVEIYQKRGKVKIVKEYLGEGKKKHFICSPKFLYNFTEDFTLKVSDKCCKRLKKEVGEKWRKAHEKEIVITGLRREEGGLRQSIKGCLIFKGRKKNTLEKFHPLLPIDEEFIDEYIKQNDIKLCALYYPPFNFKRTGCKGCPFSLDLQRQLDVMLQYLPKERVQCEVIWHKVYEEYRKIHYRLDSGLFD